MFIHSELSPPSSNSTTNYDPSHKTVIVSVRLFIYPFCSVFLLPRLIPSDESRRICKCRDLRTKPRKIQDEPGEENHRF